MILDGERHRLTSEMNNRAWLAWHIEAFARQKKLPKLKDVLTDDRPKIARTPEQFEAAVRSFFSGVRASRAQ